MLTLQVLREELGPASDEEIGRIVMRMPQVLGISAESNLRPKLRFLGDALGLDSVELRHAIERDPIALGSGLETSLRPNIDLWREHCKLRKAELRELVREKGLRWLTCSAEKRTKPRLRRLSEVGVPAKALLAHVRDTDAKFEAWLAKERVAMG